MSKTTIELYIALFESLTPETVKQFEPLVTENIRFADPFNDVRGYTKMRDIMLDMFERSESPKFSVYEWVKNENTVFIRWKFEATLPVLGLFQTDGVSRVSLDESGLVSEHVDFWDSAPLYMQIPILGRLLRSIRAKMALP